ncbi:hypothetical protein CL622_05095 [archaeon]|nr:hypothetical protein [archaeon]
MVHSDIITHPSNRIEELLQCYFHMCEINYAGKQLANGFGWKPEKKNLLAQYPNLRKDLLKSRTTPFDFGKYRWVYRDTQASLGSIFSFPTSLASWVRDSRRIYYLDKDLQAIYDMVEKPEKIFWRDIHFRFPSFAIALPYSIGNDYDCILVSHLKNPDGGLDQLNIWLISRKVVSCISRIDGFWDKFQRLLLRGKIGPARALFNDLSRKISGFHLGASALLHPSKIQNLPLSTELSELQRIGEVNVPVVSGPSNRSNVTWKPFIDQALRIVAGLFLYLDSRTVEQVGYQPLVTKPPLFPSSSGNKRTVTDIADVCHVQTIFDLTPEQRDLVDSRIAGESVRFSNSSVFHVEGYKRRVRGHGRDPDYPKTEKVKHYIKGLALLSDDELPLGAQKKM